MSKRKRDCANSDCNITFIPKAHNAIYCGAECRRIVTNKKVLSKYYENKERRADKKRVCKKKGCSTILSSYNVEEICELCQTKRLQERLISWGYDEDKIREDWSY